MKKILIGIMVLLILALSACSKPEDPQSDSSGSDNGSSQTSSNTRVPLPSTTKPTSTKRVKLTYDPNGGRICSGRNTYSYYYGLDFYSMGNTIPDNGTFLRDGYVLVGYSTKQSGGEVIGIGHKFMIPDDAKEVKLYCVWEKAADDSAFTYTVLSDNTIKIDSYSGNDKKVYIPRSIKGQIVSTIGKGAFKSDELTEVYIPSGITTIEDGAFNCSNLTQLTMFDSVTAVTENSFSGTKIKTIDLHMASYPRYKDAYAKKVERIVTSDKPCVVYLAGSSQHFGLDSDLAEQILEGKYTVVNCGTNAQINGVFYGEAITPLLDKDDILVYTPEQYAINTYWFSGNPEITEMTFRAFESSYQYIKNVDLRNYTNLFSAFTIYTTTRNKLDELYFETVSAYINDKGDCGEIPKKLNNPDFHHNKNGTFKFGDNSHNNSFVPNMNRMINGLKNRGVTVYFSHPTYNKNACDKATLNTASYNTYNNYLSRVINCKVIANVKDYIFEGQYFANTDYHLNAIGREMHTRQAMKDLLAAIKGDK